MARVSGETVIHQKIAKLAKQIAHFEQQIILAQQHIDTLQQALVILKSEPFSPFIKQERKPKSQPMYESDISPYAYRASEFVAKVFKHFPYEWLSAREMMFKAFELEGKTPDNTYFQSIATSFYHVLKRLHDKGMVEKQCISEKGATKKTKWKRKEIEA